MARIRVNNALGTLGASLTSSGTTITFAAAPSFATIMGSDYIPLVLEPASGAVPAANFEVVRLTAYTAGATTGTITRGQEGTTGVPHSNGVVWSHGPTAQDLTTYAARGWRNASLSITANTATKIPIDSVSFDPYGCLDVTTNHRYNVPVAGLYSVTAVSCGQPGHAVYAAIAVNGSILNYGGGSAGTGSAAPVACLNDLFSCAAGDYIELWTYSDATSMAQAIGASASNYLSIFKVA